MQAPRSVTKTPVRRAAPDLDEDEDGEEEYQSFVPIDELLAQGINQGDIDKLKGAGVATVDRLVNATTTKVLLAIKGITEAKIVKLKEAGKKLCLRVPGCAGACCAPYSPLFPYPHSRSLTPHAPTPKRRFHTGLDVLARRKHVVRISTGADAVNKILGGGVETVSALS